MLVLFWGFNLFIYLFKARMNCTAITKFPVLLKVHFNDVNHVASSVEESVLILTGVTALPHGAS